MSPVLSALQIIGGIQTGGAAFMLCGAPSGLSLNTMLSVVLEVFYRLACGNCTV